ncbi:carboxylesterase family protein [Spirillospora sp. NBC_00431]
MGDSVRVAEARDAGGRATTWVYRFDHPARGDNGGLGACHGAEVPFVFGTIGRADVRALIGDPPSQAVAGTAHAAWVSFVRDGAPGWSPYTVDGRVTGLLTDEINEAGDPSGEERVLWDGIR